MKNLIYIIAMLMFTSIYAQKEPTDKTEETTVKTVKVEKDGKIVEKKVSVKTKKEQAVKTKLDKKHRENSDRIDAPVKVTKTIMIDNDKDPFYDSESKIVYYALKDKKFAFNQNKNGFVMLQKNGENDIVFADARLSRTKQFYIINLENNSGVGYFNANGDFVVEYYDEAQNKMVIESFEEAKL